MLLWEIFAYGEKPYATVEVESLSRLLYTGFRMSSPHFAPSSVSVLHGRSYVETRGGGCLLVICPMILHVTRSHKRTKDVVSRRVFERPKAFGGHALEEPERSPRPYSRSWGRSPTY